MLKNITPIKFISTNINEIHLENKPYNNISTNLMITTNCKSASILGVKMFYNVSKMKESKELKKEGKYISPLISASDLKKENEICLKHDVEKGGKIHCKYGNMDYDKLNEIWKTNNHLYEIIPINHYHKLYFDIDKRFESNENDENILKCIFTLVKDVLKIDIQNDSCVSFGRGEKQGYLKTSYHIIVNNGLYFKNVDDTKKIISLLKYNVITNDKYHLLRDGILDFNVYGKNQAFKMPYQSKAFQNIIQKPLDENLPLSSFLLTHIIDNPKFYDVSNYEEVNINKKIIKTACGRKMKIEFDQAVIFKEYFSCFPKDFKLKIEGEKKDGLPYYLNSIPNNSKVSMSIFKMVGFCISNITKNSQEGLDLYTSWTKGYDKTITSKLLEPHYFTNSITKGYGWKTLYNLSRIFNKNMDNNTSIFDSLFIDEPTFKCTNQEINNRYIENENFSLLDTINNYDIISIKSPMGTGKSWSLKKIFSHTKEKEKIGMKKYLNIEEPIFSNEDLKYKSICYYSCKRAFSASMIHEFKNFGFTNYLDIENKQNIVDHERIICSVESIQYCRDNYDLIIIDESESICDNLMGQMFLKNKPIEGATKIYDMIKNSKKVLLMDAYLSSRSYNFIKDIYQDDINNKKCFFLKNNFKYPKRDYVECDKSAFIKQITKLLGEKKRCAVVCGSKMLSDMIIEDNKNFNIKSYNTKNPLKLNSNVNDEWSTCDLLVYTPTITAGISYDNLDAQFDNLFIYSSNKGSCHFRDTIQAHKRVRNFNSNVIYLCINDKFRGHPLDIMPLTFDEVEEIENKYKLQLFGDEGKTLKHFEKLSYIYNINIHNKLEFNISSICLNGFSKRYLYEENIHPLGSIIDLENIDLDVEEWNFDEIKNITPIEHEKIKNALSSMRIDKPIIDDEQIKEFNKYNYQNEQIKDEIETKVKREFFNKYYSESLERKKLRSVRSFKQMLSDIKYDFEKFNEWRIEKGGGEDAQLPIEMYDLKLKRYEHLINFFNKLGFIENQKINIDKSFYGEDFKKFIDDYKTIDVKALNTMMNEKYIRISKKDETQKELNTKQIKGIFNNLLMDEFGCEISNNGLKYIKINGKTKKLTKMIIRNYCKKPNKSNGLTKFECDEDIKIFGSSEYNRFNIYKDDFKMDQPIPHFLEEEIKSDDEEIDDEEYDDEEEEEEYNELDYGIDKKKDLKKGVKKNQCSKCGKSTFLKTCIKCL